LDILVSAQEKEYCIYKTLIIVFFLVIKKFSGSDFQKWLGSVLVFCSLKNNISNFQQIFPRDGEKTLFLSLDFISLTFKSFLELIVNSSGSNLSSVWVAYFCFT